MDADQMTLSEALRLADLLAPASGAVGDPPAAHRALQVLHRQLTACWCLLRQVRDAAGMPPEFAIADLPQAVAGMRDASAQDPVVQRVRTTLLARSQAGIQKYGTTMTREDLTTLDWLHHLQQELLDGAVYAQKLIDREQPRG